MSIAPTNHAGPVHGVGAPEAPLADGPAAPPPSVGVSAVNPVQPTGPVATAPDHRGVAARPHHGSDPWRDFGPDAPRQGRRPGSQRGRGLHGQLVQQLGYMIVSGDLGDDRPLVPEEIGQRFEVSRTVVRESLRVLEAKGLVSARPNVGTRIRPVAEWNLFDPDIIEWRAYGPGAEEQRRELVELWSGIEPAAARSAAGRIDADALAALRAAQGRMAQAVTDNDARTFGTADAEFHAVLLRAAGNRLLGHLGGVIDAALHVSGAADPGCGRFTAPSVSAHERLLEALATGDAEAAESVARTIHADDGAQDRVVPGQRAEP